MSQIMNRYVDETNIKLFITIVIVSLSKFQIHML